MQSYRDKREREIEPGMELHQVTADGGLYHAAALLSELDVQARGGGGAAERLHASCRHLAAGGEIEEGERGQAAQCAYPVVCDLDGDASSSLGDAKSSLGDAKSSLGEC
jgi:hypothetical protein